MLRELGHLLDALTDMVAASTRAANATVLALEVATDLVGELNRVVQARVLDTFEARHAPPAQRSWHVVAVTRNGEFGIDSED